MNAPQPVDEATKALVEEKMNTAKEKKAAADESFKKGDFKPALRLYYETLLYVQGLDRNALKVSTESNAPPPEQGKDPRTEADDIIEKVYCNMSACHIKNQNWQRAVECADKALVKNENNTKASFRKAKAWAGLGFTEKSITLLEKLEKLEPNNAAFKEELVAVRALDKQREKKAMSSFKGMYKKEQTSASIVEVPFDTPTS